VGRHGFDAFPRYCIGIFLIPKAFVSGLAWNPQVPFDLEQDKLPMPALSMLGRAEAGEGPISMNSLAVAVGVATTAITRLGRSVDDPKAGSSLPLDLASKIVTVLDDGIEDLLEVAEVKS
jgi:hypothetical protein